MVTYPSEPEAEMQQNGNQHDLQKASENLPKSLDN